MSFKFFWFCIYWGGWGGSVFFFKGDLFVLIFVCLFVYIVIRPILVVLIQRDGQGRKTL